jgi:integral membrane protein (TIGR01906 family)
VTAPRAGGVNPVGDDRRVRGGIAALVGWWLVSLAVPVVLIALNVRALASERFLRWEYGRPAFPSATGFSDAERMALAVPSTRFILADTAPDALLALRHAGAPLYTSEEIDHLVDVRVLVHRLSRLALAGLVWIVAAGLAAWRVGGWRRRWAGALGRGGALTVAFVLLAGAAVAVAWPLIFTGFHELLFPVGTWQFPIDSGLIRLFPERFWYDSAVAFGVLMVVEGVVLTAVGLGLGWGTRR